MTGHAMAHAGFGIHIGSWVRWGLHPTMWALRETIPAEDPSSPVAVIPLLPQASPLHLAPEAQHGGRCRLT